MTEPIAPKSIDGLPGVHHSFQADRDFKKIYETSPEAGNLCDISSACLELLGNLSEQVGFGSLETMSATTPNSRLMLFALNAQNASPPGPRIFGLTTDPTHQLQDLSNQVTKLL